MVQFLFPVSEHLHEELKYIFCSTARVNFAICLLPHLIHENLHVSFEHSVLAGSQIINTTTLIGIITITLMFLGTWTAKTIHFPVFPGTLYEVNGLKVAQYLSTSRYTFNF